MDQHVDLSLNTAASASLRHIGAEREPLLQIDDLLCFPENLVDYAAREVTFQPVYGPEGGYPGIRAPAPLDYVEAVVRGVDPLLRQAFGLERARLANAECNFSLVTLAPEALAAAQRIPHVDTTSGLQFAFLHYLCRPDQGGTAFYRHRATGFEALTPERAAEYVAARATEAGRETTGYIAGDTPHFEQTGAVEAAFNRLVIYRSRILHSGRIPPGAALSGDPREGRLTANIFVTYRT
ncbi:MAG: hypothetical protein KF730_05690 [Sphingomonas sp.]|uniref:DUF6445 family protein n=1 Tax=Sphingomonas sp. TaxID=28214 RepID=UPI0025F05AE5|nr:DUF6445 family protein [Sphingomonas sp.]MBX3564054.1 hypothetical protein [Sphingomonas sp.]